MGEFKPTHQKEFGHITQAHLVAQTAHQHLKDYVAWDSNEVEGSPSSLVEGAIAVMVAKDRVPKVARSPEARGIARHSMGTVHSGRNEGAGVGVAQLFRSITPAEISVLTE